MSKALRPYPEYKDSGVSWLEIVPAHWEIRPGMSAYRPKQHMNTGMQEKSVLSLSYGRIVVKPAEKLHGLVPASFETYQIIDPGDIIVRPTDLQNDKVSLRVGMAHDRGIITSAYLGLQTTEHFLPDYGYLLLHAYDLMKVFYGMGSGLRQNLEYTDLKRMPVAVPPIDEQSAIVRFITHADRRIRRFIRAKRRLIELLNEEKQAIINRAVTRGLDPHVRLKPSGVEWLGDVPEHWAVVALGKLAIDRCDGPFGSGLKSSHYTSQGVRVVRLQNIGMALFRGNDSAYIDPKYYATLGDHSVLSGDLLVAGLGDDNHPAGRACSAPEGLEPAMVKADCFRFRIDTSCLIPEYAAYHLTGTAIDASAMLSTGATRQRINLRATAARQIALPPVDEQKMIVSWLDEQRHHIDRITVQALSEIELIREYRTRLIADVVTGKLDVRDVEMSEAIALAEINDSIDNCEQVFEDEPSPESEEIGEEEG